METTSVRRSAAATTAALSIPIAGRTGPRTVGTVSPLRDGDTLVVVEDPALAALELRCPAEGLCVRLPRPLPPVRVPRRTGSAPSV
ncbi:hypothetical protein [Streptomyces sp. NPDC058620]|uniref:hypothetical protein n=1 Tax=Streptomyces sp. NPDC058620 TaxID=3346560 RepID=UPI003651168A